MIGRANPLARIGAATALLVALFVSTDVVTALAVLVVDLVAAPFCGIGPRRLLIRAGPLMAAAVLIGVSNGLVVAGGPSLEVGLALGLRVAAIALTGVLAVVPTDPTDLADALIQGPHLSPRLALTALASLRMVPLVAEDWQALQLARRARGLAGGRSPRRWLRLVGSSLLTVLASSIRRAGRLATAMDARGFGDGPRTNARPVHWRPSDWLLLGGGAVAAAGVIWLSVALGSWQFLLG